MEQISVAFPRLMAIFLLQDKTIYKGLESETLALEQASDPMDSPTDLMKDFKSRNPFRRVTTDITG